MLETQANALFCVELHLNFILFISLIIIPKNIKMFLDFYDKKSELIVKFLAFIHQRRVFYGVCSIFIGAYCAHSYLEKATKREFGFFAFVGLFCC